jgi:very-short-patch-repair endonuclease
MKSKTVSRILRKNQTDAEKRIWMELRAGKVLGVKFRRQHPIGPYIVDFCTIERKLTIELDGGQHGERWAEDAVRTDFLKNRGFKVIRFWNHEVLQNIEAVLEVIRVELLESPSPQPSPSKGEGKKKIAS